jgi:hypothetical protein
MLVLRDKGFYKPFPTSKDDWTESAFPNKVGNQLPAALGSTPQKVPI